MNGIIDAMTGAMPSCKQVGRLVGFFGRCTSFAFDRDDEVYVNMTPNDGTDNGATVESDHAVVLIKRRVRRR